MKTVTPAFVVMVITSRPLGARGKRVGGGGVGFAIVECGGVRGLGISVFVRLRGA